MHINKSLVGILEKNGQLIGLGSWILHHNSILTCYHLVAGKNLIPIINHEGEKRFGKVNHKRAIPELDIAFIQMDSEPEAHIIPSTNYELGEELIIPTFKIKNKFPLFPPPFETKISRLSDLDIDTLSIKRIKGTLKLQDSPQEEKIDGAPVILKRTGQIIGIVNKQLSADQIIPFNKMVYYSAAFEEEFNSWSSYLEMKDRRRIKNSTATKIEKHIKSKISMLIEQQYFSPHYFYERKAISAAMQKYLAGNQNLLTIIGKPGAGKTTILANLLYTKKNKHNVFYIDPAHFKFTHQGIKGQLYHELGITPDPMLTAIYNRIIHSPVPFIILIDGIDEMLQSPTEINSWLNSTLNWVRQSNHQLIITSSISFWDNYIKPVSQSIFRGNQLSSAIEVKPLDAAEQKELIMLYQLPTIQGIDKMYKDPFLIHIACHLSNHLQHLRKHEINHHCLFRNYINKVSYTIRKNNYSNADHRPSTVFNQLGKIIYLTQAYTINQKEIQSLPYDYQSCIQDLQSIHFLVLTHNGLQIKHKPIANYLAGNAIELKLPEFTWSILNESLSEVMEEAIPWYLVQWEYYGKDLSHHINELAEIIASNSNHHQAVNIFTNTISYAIHHDKYYHSIEKVLTTLIENKQFKRAETLTHIITHSKLSLINQLSLIKITLLKEKGKTWHFKDWSNGSFETYLQKYFEDDISIAFTAILLIQKETVLPIIATWLNDESTNHIACSILYRFSAEHIEQVFNLLANYLSNQATTTYQDDALQTIKLLAYENQELAIQILSTWQEEHLHTLLTIKIATHIANELANTTLLETTQSMLENIFRNTSSLEEKIACIRYFIWIPDYEKEMVHEILLLLKTEQLNIDIADFLRIYINKHYQTIQPVIFEYIKTGQNIDRIFECCKLILPPGQSLIAIQEFIKEIKDFVTIHPAQKYRVTGLLQPYLQAAPFGTSTYKTLQDWLFDLLKSENTTIPKELITYLCACNNDIQKREDNLVTIKELLNVSMHHALKESLCLNLLEDTSFLTDDQIFDIIAPALLQSITIDNNLYNSIAEESLKRRPSFHYLLQERICPPKPAEEISETASDTKAFRRRPFQRFLAKYLMLNRVC